MLPRSTQLNSFTDVFGDDNTQERLSQHSQPFSLSSSSEVSFEPPIKIVAANYGKTTRPPKGTGQQGEFRSLEEIDPKYRCLFTFSHFNLVQSRILEDALYSDKSMVLCAPTGSGKTVAFELAILQLLMEIEDSQYTGDFKIIYMAPVKAVCNERLTEWYPKLTKLGLLCIEVTGDTEVDFTQLKPYKVIITTPEKWDMLTRRWRDHRGLVELIKLFLIDEVHILNDETRGPVLEAVVSRMKTIELAAQSAHRIEQLQKQYQETEVFTVSATRTSAPRIRFVAVSATVSNPEDVASWLGTTEKPAVFYKFGDECRPVKLKRVVEGYPCAEGTSIFKFDIILNYKLWSIIQKYYNGKPTLIFCNTRKSVSLTADALSREITVSFNPEQKAKLTALASTLKNKKLQMLVMSGVGCHHAGLLYEERVNIERAFRNRDLPILITTTTLAMGVNLPAHLVIIKNTQQYVNGAYQEYSISTILQMVGRAGRPQFDTEATAVIMTRLSDKARYQSLVGGSEPLQSYLHKRIAENLNSEAALGTVTDVAQCVEWLRSTFLYVRAAKDPKRYLGLPPAAPMHLILKKIEELCVKAMNGLASSGLIIMDEASCIESTEAGRLMSVFYLDLETMKHIMKIDGTENLERLLWLVCESHELADMHLRMDERRCLNLLNRNNAAATIRFPMKGKISTRQMKLNCIIQAVLGSLHIPEPSLNQEALKVMKIAARVCTCLVKYLSRPDFVNEHPKYFSAVLSSIILAKCMHAHLWENSPYISRQLKGIGPTFSTLLATAGVTSFMLLEESHPRDLERIMNKGPPAGNVLRKQVSLLPKYQLTATPIDSKSVNIQLMLLNHNHLSENMDNLTAGVSHKSYLVVGDSENNLLLLTDFTDGDLISVYDSKMNYVITRKEKNEHKIYVHCVSSNIAGIDVQTEYIFQSLDPTIVRESNYFCLNEDLPEINIIRGQSSITSAPKERKRKSKCEDVTQSKEKRKRESTLTEKLKCLKECFGKTSKELKKDLDKTTDISSKLLSDILDKDSSRCRQKIPNKDYTQVNSVDLNNDVIPEPVLEIPLEDNNDYFVDDFEIDSILNDIESEIYGNSKNSERSYNDTFSTPKMPNEKHYNGEAMQQKIVSYPKITNTTKIIKVCSESRYNGIAKNVKNNKDMKTNFSFIDVIEKKAKADETDAVNNIESEKAFSEAIKSQINNFLHRAHETKLPAPQINKLLEKIYDDETLAGNTDSVLPDATESMPSPEFKELALQAENTSLTKNLSAEHIKNDNTTDMAAQEQSVEQSIHIDSDIADTEITNDFFTKCKMQQKEPDNLLKVEDTLMNEIPDYKRQSHNFRDIPNSNYNTFMSDLNATNALVLYNTPCISEQNLTEDCTVKKLRRKNTATVESLIPNEFESQYNLTPTIDNKLGLDTLDRLVVHSNEGINEKPRLIGNFIRDLSKGETQISLVNVDERASNLQSPVESYQIKTFKRNVAYSNDKNKNQVNKYSYTTTKTDVGTKTTAEHRVRITRKIKVDVDVTELITQENIKINGINSENEESIQNLKNDGDEIFSLCQSYPKLRFKDCSRHLDENNADDMIDQSQTGIIIDDGVTDNAKKFLELPLGKVVKESISYLNENNSNKMIEGSQKNEIDKENAGSSCNNNRPIACKENNIQDILQKYSKILTKQEIPKIMAINKMDYTNNCHSVSDAKTEQKSNIAKLTKRPFRIREIDTMNTSLPVNITRPVAITAQSRVSPDLKIVEISNKNDGKDQNINLDVSQELDIPNDLNESLTSIRSLDLDPVQNVKEHDDNMLNPKMLLQYFGAEDSSDILIAPPAEFCDNISAYSPTEASTLTNNIYEKYCIDNTEEENKQDIDSALEQNSYNFHSSPKEMETWTLSRDNLNSLEPISSAPWNSSQRSSLLSTSHNIRRGKLGEFKFVRKKPLKR